jgi:hypothetical protein
MNGSSRSAPQRVEKEQVEARRWRIRSAPHQTELAREPRW